MPDENREGSSTEIIEEIPLYLIPKTIADQIRTKRKAVFRILVERRFRHRYRVMVETQDEHTMRENRQNPDSHESDPDA